MKRWERRERGKEGEGTTSTYLLAEPDFAIFGQVGDLHWKLVD
jgi:hypothetical protein